MNGFLDFPASALAPLKYRERKVYAWGPNPRPNVTLKLHSHGIDFDMKWVNLKSE